MPIVASIYIFAILLGASIISSWVLLGTTQDTVSIWLFGLLTSVTVFLRILRVLAPGHRTYEGSTIGFFAGILLLPLSHFIYLVIISHLIEWVKERATSSNLLQAWYIQPFNMAKCILGGASVSLLMRYSPISLHAPLTVESLLIALLCVVTYVVINHSLLGIVLYLARGIPFQQSGLVRDGILVELPLACIGFVVMALVDRNPLALPFVFAPIVFIYQAFLFPKLKDETVESLEKLNQELLAANQSIRQVNSELFFTLAKVFDARDPFVGGHTAQVAAYSVAVANEIGLPAAQIEIIRQSAFLHDIGKIAIPEAILHKPSKLNDIEYEMIKRHSEIGADFLITSQSLHHLAPIIRHHHERWDGKGYPDHLMGGEIPLESRILNVCDSVEAMASDRPYHRAMSIEEICIEVARCAGIQFDPEVAQAFIRIAEREGPKFIFNSARSVAALYANTNQKEEGIFIKRLAEIYGMGS